MKLYATTTSERASKGQGGKDLQIEIFNETKISILKMFISPKEGSTKAFISYTIDENELSPLNNLKGKNQKGEKVNKCIECGKELPEEWTGLCYKCN